MKNWMKNVVAAVVPTIVVAGIAWAANNVTNTTGTSTSGNVMQECGATGVCSSDAGIAVSAVSTVVGTPTSGDAMCSDGGTSITDCGVAPVTTIPAYSVLMNDTASSAGVSAVAGTGTGVPVLAVNPVFTGGIHKFESASSAVESFNIEYEGPPTDFGNGIFASVYGNAHNSSGTTVTFSDYKFGSLSDTAGAQSGFFSLYDYISGTNTLDFYAAGGVSIGGSTTHGAGTIDATGAYYANGTVGVSCASGINATTYRSVNGITTHC